VAHPKRTGGTAPRPHDRASPILRLHRFEPRSVNLPVPSFRYRIPSLASPWVFSGFLFSSPSCSPPMTIGGWFHPPRPRETWRPTATCRGREVVPGYDRNCRAGTKVGHLILNFAGFQDGPGRPGAWQALGAAHGLLPTLRI